MPNDVANHLTISGPQHALSAFAQHVGAALDFPALRPVPDDLNITSGLDSRLAQDLIAFEDHPSRTEPLEKMLKWPAYQGFKTASALYAHLLQGEVQWKEGRRERMTAYLQRIRRHLNEHGAATWYEWCIQNWGTKWPAYRQVTRVSPQHWQAWFDTANSPPIALLLHLSGHFLALTFDLACCDPLWPLTGQLLIQDRNVTHEQHADTSVFEEADDLNENEEALIRLVGTRVFADRPKDGRQVA